METRRAVGLTLCMAAAVCLAGCGGGGYSAPPPPPPQLNPSPSLAMGSLSPNSTIVGGGAFTLTVTGANFVSSSTVQWNGSARATAFVSSASLQAAVTPADIAAAGTAMVTVSTPAPGGGISSALDFAVNNPTPAVAVLGPNAAFAGDAGFTLIVTGTNFLASSTVQWNGSARTTTFMSNTSLQAAITTADIANVGTATVTVANPAPGGGTSNGLPFTIKVPPPKITLLSPSSAVMGSASFTLTVTGKNFGPTSTVQWKGSARTTVFVSSTSLQASIDSADIASAGMANITVANPQASGGVSAASTFFVGTTGGANFAVITVNQEAQDIVYDPAGAVFYLSVTSTAASNTNTICVLDPATGTITSTHPAGSNPNVLAISDDSQFLYAGIDGSLSVQRFILPGLGTDINYPVGTNALGANPFFALDLRVAPGMPHTTAVALGAVGGPTARGGITIFDDAKARPTSAPGFGNGRGIYDSIAWTSDSTEILAANFETSSFDFYTLPVNSSGITLGQDFSGVFSTFTNRIHLDAGTNLIYADEGHVINPATGLPVGNFNVTRGPGVMIPDSSLNAAFFISAGSGSTITIQSFDLTHFTPIGSISIPNITGSPIHLIRWGENGLAFNTGGFGLSGQVYVVGGSFISPAPPFAVTAPPAPSPLPVPAANAPKIAFMDRSSAIQGAAFTLTVSGTNFDPAATVQFNGSALVTNFVSSATLQAMVTSANTSTPGTVSVTVANPSTSGGTSAPSTFFVGPTGGVSSLGRTFAMVTVSQTSKDLAYDPVHREIFLSVPEGSASGNTISVLDIATAKIVGAQFAGSNPNVLAMSDDSQFLYVGMDGSSSVQRFALPGLGQDLNYSLGSAGFFGPQFALDLGVAPGASHTTAVTLGVFNVGPNAQGGIKIFDDATARPTGANIEDLNHLQWGGDASTVFATGELSSSLFVLSVIPSGVAVSQNISTTFGDTRPHFDAGTKLVYSDSGLVVNPVAGTVAGTFSASGLMVPDSALNKAFFLIRTFGSPTVSITSFDLTTFAQIDTIIINNVTGSPQRLIRWGQNGLAFNTDGGQVVLIGGNFVH